MTIDFVNRIPSRSNSWLKTAALVTLLGIGPTCASTTIILSQPSGARVFLNGETVGNTPYTLTDTRIVGSVTTVRLELPGYEPFNAAVVRNEEFDVGACIGGVLVLVPFLWIMGYKPTHTFQLQPIGVPPGYYAPPAATGPGPAMAPPPAAAAVGAPVAPAVAPPPARPAVAPPGSPARPPQ
jgi:hypothetical protein